jgi:UDP-N-acetyl-D-glucosamine dehydrogenase
MNDGAVRRVAIVGLGYIGLPIALRSVEAGYTVIAVDADPHRIAILVEGQSYVEVISDEDLADASALAGSK